MCPVRTYEIWPAQHDWLRRYFVFERATYALRRNRGWSKHQRIQWLKSKILNIDFE